MEEKIYTERDQKEIKKREHLEAELDVLGNAIVEVEVAGNTSEATISIVERLINKRKHEIEQELIMLPRDNSDDYDVLTAHQS